MQHALLWILAGLLFAGAWAAAHYARFNDAAELVALGAVCLLALMGIEDA